MSITKTVPVKLNDVEYRERSQRLAAIDRELTGIGKQKKKVVADFNAKIQTLESEKENLIKTVETGEEDRPVTCDEESDHERGVVYFVRQDTKERIGHRAMSSHEKQLSVPGTEKKDVPFGRTKEGEIIELTPAQRDALRFALEKGDEGLPIEVEGRGDLLFVAIHGVEIEEPGKKGRGRRKQSEGN